jgi:hypothetical protein
MHGLFRVLGDEDEQPLDADPRTGGYSGASAIADPSLIVLVRAAIAASATIGAGT